VSSLLVSAEGGGQGGGLRRFLCAPHPVALEVKLGDGDVGVAAESGHGDGSYPVYRGVDETGEIVQLVVDFLVLAAEDVDGALVHR